MKQEKIDRISELTRISRTRELTPQEQEERRLLREEYLQAIRGNMKQLLDNTTIIYDNGDKAPLKKEQNNQCH